MRVDNNRMVDMYRQMLRINMVECHMESLYHLDEMKTPLHLCIGQEAVAVGVCAALEKTDYVCSNHRGHGHYLAKGGDLKSMIAELHCKETGCSKGRGGSMHLVDTSVGIVGSSSIVGGGIPIATGLALSIRMKKEDRVSVVFFGDGAADEGTLYESINFAVLKRLPVIFVLENNRFSVCSRVSARQYGEVIFHNIPAEHMYTRRVDGNAVLEVFGAAREAIERARSGQGPSFIECETYRMRGHAGSGDSPPGYRPKEELEAWEEKCPVKAFRGYLLDNNVLSTVDVERMQADIHSEIEEAFQFAQEGPLPSGDDLHLYLFQE